MTRMLCSQDYYPFGSLQPGRNWNSDQYRFGFNGKENDNEVKGIGNQQDYGMRIYDPRLGRFLSTDPLIVKEQKYPWYSPYHFAGNNPIRYIDLDGLEECEPYQIKANWLLITTFQTAAKAAGEYNYRNKYELYKYDYYNADYNYNGVENEDHIVNSDFSTILKRNEGDLESFTNYHHWRITVPINDQYVSGEVQFWVKANKYDMIVTSVRVADGYESDGAMSGSGGYKVKFKNSKDDVVVVVAVDSQSDLDLLKKEYRRIQNTEYLKYVKKYQDSEIYKKEKEKIEGSTSN